MPSTTEKQRKFMGAELARKRAGKKTRTGMTEGQLKDYARKPLKMAEGGEARAAKLNIKGQPAKRAKPKARPKSRTTIGTPIAGWEKPRNFFARGGGGGS